MPDSDRKTKSHSVIWTHPPLRKSLRLVSMALCLRLPLFLPVHVSDIIGPPRGCDTTCNKARMDEIERFWFSEVEAIVEIGNLLVVSGFVLATAHITEGCIRVVISIDDVCQLLIRDNQPLLSD